MIWLIHGRRFLVSHTAGDMGKRADQQSGPLPGSHLGTGAVA